MSIHLTFHCLLCVCDQIRPEMASRRPVAAAAAAAAVGSTGMEDDDVKAMPPPDQRAFPLNSGIAVAYAAALMHPRPPPSMQSQRYGSSVQSVPILRTEAEKLAAAKLLGYSVPASAAAAASAMASDDVARDDGEDDEEEDDDDDDDDKWRQKLVAQSTAAAPKAFSGLGARVVTAKPRDGPLTGMYELAGPRERALFVAARNLFQVKPLLERPMLWRAPHIAEETFRIVRSDTGQVYGLAVNAFWRHASGRVFQVAFLSHTPHFDDCAYWIYAYAPSSMTEGVIDPVPLLRTGCDPNTEEALLLQFDSRARKLLKYGQYDVSPTTASPLAASSQEPLVLSLYAPCLTSLSPTSAVLACRSMIHDAVNSAVVRLAKSSLVTKNRIVLDNWPVAVQTIHWYAMHLYAVADAMPSDDGMLQDSQYLQLCRNVVGALLIPFSLVNNIVQPELLRRFPTAVLGEADDTARKLKELERTMQRRFPPADFVLHRVRQQIQEQWDNDVQSQASRVALATRGCVLVPTHSGMALPVFAPRQGECDHIQQAVQSQVDMSVAAAFASENIGFPLHGLAQARGTPYTSELVDAHQKTMTALRASQRMRTLLAALDKQVLAAQALAKEFAAVRAAAPAPVLSDGAKEIFDAQHVPYTPSQVADLLKDTDARKHWNQGQLVWGAESSVLNKELIVSKVSHGDAYSRWTSGGDGRGDGLGKRMRMSAAPNDAAEMKRISERRSGAAPSRWFHAPDAAAKIGALASASASVLSTRAQPRHDRVAAPSAAAASAAGAAGAVPWPKPAFC
jgi:hypothetical protein